MTHDTRDRYRKLLEAALPYEVDESNQAPDAKYFVVVPAHVRALDPQVELVRGGRGVGKSSWYQAVTSDDDRVLERLRTERAQGGRVRAARGYGNEKAIDDHPDADVIGSLLDDGVAPRAVWQTIVLWHATDTVAQLPTWGARSSWVTSNPEDVARALAVADGELVARDQTLLVLFDALDTTASTWERRRGLLRALLELLLDLKGYRRLRGKAFVRPDMLEYGDVLTFVDASKLTARAVDLDWRPRDLYRLLWQRMGNAPVPEAAWFREQTGGWEQHGDVFLPPSELVQSEDAQKTLLHGITGPYMGTNHRRGYPYTWLPKHLADSQQRVSPRSFLLALRSAVESTTQERYDHPWALHYEAIKQGVQRASRTRVAEIKEDVPWIDVALGPLEGLSVPCSNADVEQRWREAGTVEALGARPAPEQPQRIGEGSRGLREELVALGILEAIGVDRLNMADVYRVAFKLGRKGGVKPL